MTLSSDTTILLAVVNLAIVGSLFVLTVLRRRPVTRARGDATATQLGTTLTPPAPELSPLEIEVQRNERLLEVRQQRLGRDHPDVATICQILGQLHVSGLQYDRAMTVLERALSIAEPNGHLDPLSVASILEDLAILDEKLARHESAEARWRRALDLRARRLPRGHPDLLWTATRLATYLCKQRSFSSAETALRAVTDPTLPDSRQAVLAMSTLATALAEQGKDREAKAVVAQARLMMDAIAERGGTTSLSSELDLAANVATTVDLVGSPTPTADTALPVATSYHARPTSDRLADAHVRALAFSGKVRARSSLTLALARSTVAKERALGPRLTARAEDDRRTDFAARPVHSAQLHSAQRRLSKAQRHTVLAVVAVIAVMGVFAPIAMAQLLIAVVTALYLAALGFRVHAFWRGLRAPRSIDISDGSARSIANEDLPVYTILVAAYHEPEVIGRLISSLVAIEYPADRLDVKLLLEADDGATLQAARAAQPPAHIKIVRVPVSQPRTKPKALNYGLQTARGQLITIYDAEDRPEPLQLRRAVVAFGSLPKRVVCLQAKLSYHNAGQNLLTRWFTAEYATWFSHLLPGLAERRMPLPLGGTSNHFRRAALESVGAWDPYNVTEDADLGIRLYRAGFAVEVLESTTLEEANSDFINWTKQRSRWYKGYLQTWLVHMRDPVRLWRELGPGGFLGFNLFIGGTPVLTLVSPLFWTLTAVWFVSHWTLIPLLFPGWLYHLSLLSLVVGNLAFMYMGVVSARATGRPELVPAMIIAPLYWAMMSLAAIKAFIQLVAAPSFWEKTTHGLDRPVGAENATT